jgi:hypothetical protein
MNRGPKPKTSKNSPSKPVALASDLGIVPTSPLNANALVEFERLVATLDQRGMLERMDVGVITACARAKDRADGCNADVNASQSDIAQAENIYLGRLRALALTQMPSRSLVKTTAKDVTQVDPIKALIKLA